MSRDPAGEDPRTLVDRIRGQDAAAPVRDSGSGAVLSVRGPVARISGLPRAMAGERVEIDLQDGGSAAGLVLELRRDHVICAVLGDASAIRPGDVARPTERLLDVPVGEALRGRVVDSLGAPIDGKGPVEAHLRGRLHAKGQALQRRTAPREALSTGIKLLDSLVPLARGSHTLLLGDRGSGKTTIAVDTILSQRDSGVACVYVAIGQRLSEVRRVVELLSARGAMDHTTVVVAAASDAASLRYVAPFTGMALAEHHRCAGRHALCILDDLGSHARAHGEVALLADRPLGSEGYPADLVSMHARLLDRAESAAATDGESRGAGSLTVLSLVETESGDRSAFLPRSLAMIADARLVLDAELFRAGRRPAVDLASSSALASRPPIPALSKIAGWKGFPEAIARHHATAKRMELLPDLDEKSRAHLARSARLVELVKQDAHAPIPPEQQALLLYAATRGLLDDLRLSDLRRFEQELSAFATSERRALLDDLAHERLDADIESRMRQTIHEVKKRFEE